MLKGFWADKNKRNLLIVLIVIILLALVLIGFIIAQQVLRNYSDGDSQTSEEVDLVSWPDEMLITISELGVKGYLAETDKQIESTTSNEAEEINPTIDSAHNIYYFEDKIGSKEEANKYLRIAEERGFNKKKGRG